MHHDGTLCFWRVVSSRDRAKKRHTNSTFAVALLWITMRRFCVPLSKLGMLGSMALADHFACGFWAERGKTANHMSGAPVQRALTLPFGSARSATRPK